MKPITKAEVEAAIKNRTSLWSIEESAIDEIDRRKHGNNERGWLLVGYEIARARAEKGEEL